MKFPDNWKDYELLDFGDNRKLERFGEVITDRPEPSADEAKILPAEKWKEADTCFTEKKGQKGSWDTTLDNWTLSYPLGSFPIQFKLQQSAFKHVGIFPEQAENWEFIHHRCSQLLRNGITPKVLNLFAYTGGASLAANLSGAEVTHVDSVKSVVTWARQNAELNKIDTIRWIVEDARKFTDRCVRRGEQYHGIIMDPPIYGLGPKGSHWKLNRDLPELIDQSMKLLHPEHRFFILNTYSPQLPLKDLNSMLTSVSGFPKLFESTKLGLKSTSGKEIELGNLVRF